MALQYSPKIVTDSLVMCLDASNNKSYPTDLPVKNGLLLWLDAADDSTFSYSSGTVVSQWRDKSGLNNHTNQSNVAYQPQRNTFTNSRKTTVFNSSYLTTQTNILKAYTSYTKIAVVKQTSNAVGNIIGKSTGANTTFWYNGSNNIRLYHNSSTILTSSVATTLNTWSILSGLFDSNLLNANIYVNGSSGGSATSPTVTQITTDSDVEIGGFNGAGNYFAGEISEILIYNRALSLTELKQVHTYLGQKWGISNTDRSIVDLAGNDDNGLFGNGTVANMPLYDYYNKGAFKFFASNKYIKLGNNTNINQFAGDFSVSLWAMATAENANYGNLIGDYLTTGAQTTAEWQIMMNNSSAFLNVYRVGTGYIINNVSSGFSANTWINVVLTRIGDAVTLYANNTVIGTATNSNVFGSATGSVNIGIDGNNAAEPFSGLISNVLIYKKGLSAAEVLQNYEALKSKFANTIVQQGLVLNLDAGNPYSYAGAGTAWYDVSGNNYNGTLTSSPVYSTDSGGAFTFAGNYSLSPASTVNSLNGDALTVEAWIKHDSFGVAGTGRGYVSNWHSFNTLNQRGFILRTYDTQTNPSFWWCWGGGNNYDAFGPSSYVMQTGRIYHIVATYEKNVAVKIYINGNLEGTGTNSVGNTIAFDTTNGVYVGFSNINNSYMYGNIYSTRLYNRVLTAAQVLQNYNATKGRFGL